MLTKFRAYRDHTRANAVSPLGIAEYLVGRAAGKLIVVSFKMAKRRGDFEAMNANMLAIWAGNQAGDGQPIHALKPYQISRAIKGKSLRIVIEDTV